MVKNPPSFQSKGPAFDPWSGNEDPTCSGQLSPHTTTAEPACSRAGVPQIERSPHIAVKSPRAIPKDPHAGTKIHHARTKTRCSQKQTNIKKKIKYPGAEGSEDLDKKQRRGVGTPSVRTGMDASRDMLGKVQEAVWLKQD